MASLSLKLWGESNYKPCPTSPSAKFRRSGHGKTAKQEWCPHNCSFVGIVNNISALHVQTAHNDSVLAALSKTLHYAQDGYNIVNVLLHRQKSIGTKGVLQIGPRTTYAIIQTHKRFRRTLFMMTKTLFAKYTIIGAVA